MQLIPYNIYFGEEFFFTVDREIRQQCSGSLLDSVLGHVFTFTFLRFTID